MSDIRFEDPWFFLLLLLIPAYIIYARRTTVQKHVQMRMSSLEGLKRKSPVRIRLLRLLPVFRLLAFISLVIALARPQTNFSNSRIYAEGIDIMMALDVSSSMYAIDFKPNRITAAKVAANSFIDARENDRIGLVVFAGEAFTQCPATLDHTILKAQVETSDNWYLKDGTAIGDGLYMAVNRLADTLSTATKVIILLTDGVRIGGKFSPLDAAQAAKQLNIRVYTIGVGTKSDRPIPVLDRNGRSSFELDPRTSYDEPLMRKIADMTGGAYFEAGSPEKLIEVYQEIDKIEKQKIIMDVTRPHEEQYFYFALTACILLLVEIILSNTIFRTLT